MSKYTQEPWPDNVPMAGPDRPANDGSIDYLIKYLMTVRKRFGNTTVTCDLHWGASALHKLSDHAALLAVKDEEIKKKDEEIGRLRKVLKEALEPGVFGPWGTIIDPAFGPEIEALCEERGYGALMHHVEALWKRKAERIGVPGSEHTCAACASVRREWIEDARQALKETPNARPDEDERDKAVL